MQQHNKVAEQIQDNNLSKSGKVEATQNKLQQFISSTPGKYIGGTAAVFGIIGIMFGAVFLISNLRERESGNVVSPDDEITILSQVIRNNPEIRSNVPGNITEENPGTNGGDDPAPNPPGETQPVPPDPNNPTKRLPLPVQDSPSGRIDYSKISIGSDGSFNYKYSKKTTTKGNGYERCSFYSFEDPNSTEMTEENYVYFDENRSYFKRVSTTGDGELLQESITRYGNDVNDFTSFANGDYAIKALYEIYPYYNQPEPVSYPVSTPDSYPSSYPVSYGGDAQLVREIFGGQAKITGLEEIDGVTYYDITVNYSVYCNLDYRNAVYIYRVHGESFNIIRTQVFLGTVEEDNLIITHEYLDEERSFLNSGIDEIFSLSEDITQREINYRDYTYDPQKRFDDVKNYIVGANLDVSYLDIDGYELNWAFGKDFPELVDGEKYYKDRAYYSNSNLGQDRYDRLVEMFDSSPLLYSGFGGPDYYPYISIRLFDTNRTIDDVLDYTVDAYSENVESSITLDGLRYDATLRSKSYTYSYYGYYPTSYPISYNLPISYSVSGSIYTPTYYDLSAVTEAYGLYHNYIVYSSGVDNFTEEIGLDILEPNNTEDKYYTMLRDYYLYRNYYY